MTVGLLFTPDEAFAELKIGRAKGFQMIASGELPSIKIGRLRRIPVDGLRAWVQGQVAAHTTVTVKAEQCVGASERERGGKGDSHA
jgi:excisionase family DNA binding protein